MNRIIAIDWSGNKRAAAQRKHIWMAELHHGAVNLSNDRTCQETIDEVIATGRKDHNLVVGLDFAFSYPAWFLDQQGCTSAPMLWKLLAENDEVWLSGCAAPFWGRPKTTCPDDHGRPTWRGFRKTELDVREGRNQNPKSTFQIGGAGAVGTGSMRGMPYLLELQRAGFFIWPFDPPRLPMVIEIYPRIFTGRTNVSDAAARARHLEQESFSALSSTVLAAARNSPDAFDALCALMGMVRHADELAALERATDPIRLLEGEIWMPREM